MFYKWQRLDMKAAYDPAINSTGREFLGRKLVPHFSDFFKDGDKILCTGKQPFWDYSTLFNNTMKFCEYITVDIREETEPDIVDDLGKSKMEDSSFDGILCIGLFDSLIESSAAEVKAGLTKLLKKGGRMLLATNIANPTAFIAAWPEFMIDEIYYIHGEGNKVGSEGYYQTGVVQSSFAILRKR